MRFGISINLNDGSFSGINSSNLREDVRIMYEKYKDVFTFRLTTDVKNPEERRFYVYEWFLKDSGKVFYIGKGTGSRFKHILNDYRFEELRDNFEIDYRLVLKDLTNDEAEIYEVCWIYERTKQGEVLLQYADKPFNSEEHNKMLETFRERKFQAKIEVSDYKRRYFNITGEYSFDLINAYELMKTHFLSSDWRVEPYTLNEKDTIRNYIEKHGGKVYISLAKAALSVIEFGILDYDKYIKIKEKGYKIFHSFDVMEFIKKNEFIETQVNIPKKVNIPKFDIQAHTEMITYLTSIKNGIETLAKSYRDDGYKAEVKGFEYEKNGDYKNAIKYMEASILKGFEAPAVYLYLAKIYRKFGMFDDELRVLELGVKNVSPNNTSIGNIVDRKRKVNEILQAIL